MRKVSRINANYCSISINVTSISHDLVTPTFLWMLLSLAVHRLLLFPSYPMMTMMRMTLCIPSWTAILSLQSTLDQREEIGQVTLSLIPVNPAHHMSPAHLPKRKFAGRTSKQTNLYAHLVCRSHPHHQLGHVTLICGDNQNRPADTTTGILS